MVLWYCHEAEGNCFHDPAITLYVLSGWFYLGLIRLNDDFISLEGLYLSLARDLDVLEGIDRADNTCLWRKSVYMWSMLAYDNYSLYQSLPYEVRTMTEKAIDEEI
jgi:hypothetical protein